MSSGGGTGGDRNTWLDQLLRDINGGDVATLNRWRAAFAGLPCGGC